MAVAARQCERGPNALIFLSPFPSCSVSTETCMSQEQPCPQSFVEMVLALLEDRFPWLTSAEEEQSSGGDTVDELWHLHKALTQRRSDTQSNTTERNE